MRELVAIDTNQTAIFTLPNGVKLSVAIDECSAGSIFIRVCSDDSTIRASIHFGRNCGNEGWIEARVLPPIKPERIKDRPR